jgi:GNAT superfamily N-acetyltransferase
MPTVPVTTWYLEMTDPGQLAPAPAPLPGLEIRRAEEPSPELSRGMYAAVGADWWWIDRLDWDWARWHAHLARPDVETWLAWLRGTPIGYAELVAADGDVELGYLGLLPAFIGRGAGTRLLDAALRRAWVMTDPPPRRVWVHTCSLDGPAALRAYESRGLRRYAEETTDVTLPANPLQPWPGAGRPPLRGSDPLSASGSDPLSRSEP